MGIFTSEKFNSLEELFVHELKDLYDAEYPHHGGPAEDGREGAQPML